MIAFKAFSKELTTTMGDYNNRDFQFEIGKTYEEKECKCAKNGYHCAENPLCCLTYYNSGSRFLIVKAEGDINQDGYGSRISCTKLTLVKEISLLQMGVYACQYIQKYPKRELESRYAVKDYGVCTHDFLIVRGKKPVASGEKGTVIFFMEEDDFGEITSIFPIEIGEDGYQENTEYESIGGNVVICKKAE